MNEEICDIHDVTKAAADLVAYGCTVGATHFDDGMAQLTFGSFISSFANQIIKAVDEGVISAWQGVEEIRAEYEGLHSKVLFYAQNGIGVVAGVAQVRTGVSVVGSSGGLGALVGAFFIGHGVNNIYEGIGNIANGPGARSTVGPVRRAYQIILEDEHKGNIYYYAADLGLSAMGLLHMVRKPGSIQLFRNDSINYERSYRQSSKLALLFEGLIDSITVNSMMAEVEEASK